MIRFFRHFSMPAMLAVAACAPKPPPEPPPVVEEPPAEVEQQPAWRGIVRVEDRDKIDGIARAWDEAIERMGERRYRALQRAEEELVDPSVAQARPAPPPGPYWCRTIKLGVPGNGGFTAFRPFNCYVEVEGELLTLVKQGGSERPAGRLYADTEPGRLVFLGGLALGGDKTPPAYGDDPDRNVAGVVERVGPFRYRLVIPYPRGESLLDILELVPLVEGAPVLRPSAVVLDK